MLSLVRDTYQPADDLTDLFPCGGFANRVAVEDHLLRRVLTMAYTARPGQDPPRYSVDQANRWLGDIATRMTERRTRDLAWWLIQQWKPRWFRVAATGLTVLLTLGFGLSFLLGGILHTTVLSYSFIFAVVMSVFYGARVGQPRQWSKIRWSEIVSADKLKVVSLFFLVTSFMSSAMVSIWFGYAYGLTAGLFCGIAASMVTWFFYAAAKPSIEPVSPLTPLACWRREHRYRVVFGLVHGFAFGMAFSLATLLNERDQWNVLDTIVGSMLGAIPYGLVFGVVSSNTWTAGLAFFQIGVSGSGPFRMLRFLEDAQKRGVLRAVGPVYQFRHARLQDLLAETRPK